MIIPDWIIPLAYLGGAIGTIGLIARLMLGAVRAAGKLDTLVASIPTLNEIAQDFKKNGGSSLKDAVDRIEEASTQAVIVSGEAKVASVEAKVEVAKIALAVKDMAEQTTLNNRILHELKGKMSPVTTAANPPNASPIR